MIAQWPKSMLAPASRSTTRERARRELGIKSTSDKAGTLRGHLGRQPGEGRVGISPAAHGKAQRNLYNDVMRTTDDADAGRVFVRAAFLVDGHLGGVVCAGDPPLVNEALKMYKATRSSPRSQKLAEWHLLKSRHMAHPTLGAGKDLAILPTAAQHAKRRHVELWTRGMDFAMFAGEIAARFNVEVVGAYRLGERFVGQGRPIRTGGRGAAAALC